VGFQAKLDGTDRTVQELTHLNFAFAYVDPATFNVVTMDPDTPASLFVDAANAKIINPKLQVWLSIGGWTFSDNGTSTQPVLGNIARSAANRQTFANNLVKFMLAYGFDGVDIDWEYPGAPDRGGQPDDVANFPLLMHQISQRSTGQEGNTACRSLRQRRSGT
jgi:chitinase